MEAKTFYLNQASDEDLKIALRQRGYAVICRKLSEGSLERQLWAMGKGEVITLPRSQKGRLERLLSKLPFGYEPVLEGDTLIVKRTR